MGDAPDAETSTDDTTDDTLDAGPVTYQFSIERETWREWSNTVPRSTPLYARLRDLIEQDARAAGRDDGTDMEQASVQLLASRIRIRATQALGAVRDGDDVDAETAIEELQEVIDLADALEE